MNGAIFLRIDAYMVPLANRDRERYDAILDAAYAVTHRHPASDPDLEPCLSDFPELPIDFTADALCAWDTFRAQLVDLTERDGPHADVTEVAA